VEKIDRRNTKCARETRADRSGAGRQKRKQLVSLRQGRSMLLNAQAAGPGCSTGRFEFGATAPAGVRKSCAMSVDT